MRIVIEIEGKRHRLLKGLTRLEDPCDKCSLWIKCKGSYTKQAKDIKHVCETTYSGFRKIYDKR